MNYKSRTALYLILLFCFSILTSTCAEEREIVLDMSINTFENSVGMEFVRIDPGTFLMGETNRIPSDLRPTEYSGSGDWDEKQIREVSISNPFFMGVREVTIEQFQEYRSEYTGVDKYSPYATGVSWYDAQEFVDWLSDKEGIPYRLPTEAEWEYAARAGTNSLFWSGNSMPEEGLSNPWGLENIHTGVAEWVNDWHGVYPYSEQVDPVGDRKSTRL